MERRLNKFTKIIIGLFVVLTFFVCVVGASSVSDSAVNNTNVYGASGSVDISTNPISSTATNIVHNSDEYVYISGLNASVSHAIINQNITLTPIDQRGASVYLNNSSVVNGYVFDYDTGGHAVDGNPLVVTYESFGNKVINLTLTGWDGTTTITQSVSTNVTISYISNMTVDNPFIGGGNSTGVHVSTISAGTLNYQWYATNTPNETASWNTSMFTNGQTANPTFNGNGLSGGIYYLKVVITGQGLEQEDSYDSGFNNVTVTTVEPTSIAQPTISFNTTSSVETFLNGSINTTVYLSVDTPITPYGTLTYQWYDGNNPISGLTGLTNQQVIINDVENTLHNFTVHVYNWAGSELMSESISPIVSYQSFIPPVIQSITSNATTLIFGDNPCANITASMLQNGDVYTYNWQYNKNQQGAWIDVGDVNSSSNSLIMNFTTLGMGTYYIRAHVYGYGGDSWSAQTESQALRIDVVGAGVATATPLVGDTSTEIHLESSAQEYDSIYWYVSIDSGAFTNTTLSGISQYYQPTQPAEYRFHTQARYGEEIVYSNNVSVKIYEIPVANVQSPSVVIGDSVNLDLTVSQEIEFVAGTDVQWKLSKDGITYNDISTTLISSNRTKAVYTYTPSAGMGGQYSVRAVITYFNAGSQFIQTIDSTNTLSIYECPTITVSPIEGNSTVPFTLNATNTGYNTITWMISQNGQSYVNISSPMSPSSLPYSYTSSENMSGQYSIRGQVNWESPAYSMYTNVVNVTIFGKPAMPIIQPIQTTIASQEPVLDLNLQSGYAPVSGDSYTYIWYCHKEGESIPRILGTTIDNPHYSFLTNVSWGGAGTYNFSVSVTGKGGTTLSDITTAYVIGVTNISIANTTMDYKSLMGIQSTIVGSSNVYVHWYATTTPSNNSSWSDIYIANPTIQNTTFGNTAGIPSGNYTFKMILSGSFGTLDTYNDIGITNIYTNVYRIPYVENLNVTRCVDIMTPITVGVNAIIDSDASITSYNWQYSSTNGLTWFDMGINASSGNYSWLTTTQQSSATKHDVGNYLVRVTMNTSEGYSKVSDAIEVSVINLSITTSSSSIQQGSQVSIMVSGQNLIPSETYQYEIQSSSTDGNEWTNVASGSLTSINWYENKSIILTSLGNNILRVHAWNNGVVDYYTYAPYPNVSVLVPPKFTVTSNVSDGENASSVSLTLTYENGGTGVGWKWEKSVDSGQTWTSLDSSWGTRTSRVEQTSTSNMLTLYRVVGKNNAYSNIYSNVVGYLYHPNTSVPVTNESGISTSTADRYSIPTKTSMPYTIIDVYSLSSVIGLVVTEHALYLVDASNKNTSNPSVISTYYISSGTIASSKYYKGYLMYETTDNRIILQTIIGASGFGNSVEIRGYTGTVSDYDMSNYNYMVAVQGNGIYTYDVNGNLQWFISDTSSTAFAMSKVTTDSNLEYVVFASSSNSNVVKAYIGQSQSIDIQVPNNVQQLYTITYDAERLLIVTNTNTLSYSYTLTFNASGISTFAWGNYVTMSNVLSHPSSVRSGILYAGTTSRTLYIFDGVGNKVGEYPTADVLSATDIAKSSGDFVMTGGANGQVAILQNTGNGWQGMQSVPLPSALRALSMSESANSFFACTANTVYCGIKYEADASGTVLTTTYYLKITVTDSYGNTLANNGVKVVSPTGTNLYTTDSAGTVTVEVIPTNTYTISLPNGEDTVIYTADNYALQYVTLRYPSTATRDNLSYNAVLRDNRYIDVSFSNGNPNPYNVKVTIYNGNKSVQFERSWNNTVGFNYTFDSNNVTAKTFIVNITADPSGNYDNHIYRTYVLEIKTEISTSSINASSHGTKSLVLGTIPLIPTEMDEKWRMLIFGGLIMIIGALFSYQHSTKGSVIVAIIASVMTYFGILPLNPVWIGCMVFLAILTVYSFSAQNEG